MGMGYTLEHVNIQNALEHITDYDYALIYNISSMELCEIQQLAALDLEECQEARFFSEEKELHIFEGEDGKEAILIKDKDPEYIMTKRRELSNKWKKTGDCILIQEYIAYDEDGQLFVEHTRLKGIQ